METRLRKLSLDQARAVKQLKKTMDFHDHVDRMQKRKDDDLSFKAQWLDHQHRTIELARRRNSIERAQRKASIRQQRQRVVLQNVMSREQKKHHASKLFEIYSHEQGAQL